MARRSCPFRASHGQHDFGTRSSGENMTNTARFRIAISFVVFWIAVVPYAAAQQSQVALAYTVSMPQPSNHVFHVALRVDGLTGEFHDFKCPPGIPATTACSTTPTMFRTFAHTLVQT